MKLKKPKIMAIDSPKSKYDKALAPLVSFCQWLRDKLDSLIKEY